MVHVNEPNELILVVCGSRNRHGPHEKMSRQRDNKNQQGPAEDAGESVQIPGVNGNGARWSSGVGVH
jgi:hypothetical protein